ncbi:hypothetical protein BVX99_01910 [bacterium F16]|nr:hypothetical protein BVX99_01910 [bacterium F16]
MSSETITNNDSPLTKRQVLAPHIVVPLLAGLFSCLAVVNATRLDESIFRSVMGYGVWFLIGAALVVIFSTVSTDDLIRYSPLVGGLGLIVLYSSVLIGGLFYFGTRGTIGILPSLGIFAAPWELLMPVYLLWLVRFSPTRVSRGMIGWKPFAMFIGMAGIWWIPLIIIPTVSGFIYYFVLFLILCWFDSVERSKVLPASLVGLLVAGLSFYWMSSPGGYLSTMISHTEHDLFATSFGNGRLLGNAANNAYQIKFILPSLDSFTVFLSIVERIGLLGILLFLGLGLLTIAWGYYKLSNKDDAGGLVSQLFVSYFIFRSVLFLCAVTGMFPCLDLSAPLLNASGSDLVAAMFMLMVITHSRK